MLLLLLLLFQGFLDLFILEVQKPLFRKILAILRAGVNIKIEVLLIL